MGMTFVTEPADPDLTIPEDTFVKAQLVELKPREMKWNDKVTGLPQSKQRIEWWWQITSPETYAMRRIKGECDAEIKVGSQFHTWAEALLDRTVPIGMPIDTDDLIGLNGELTVSHRKSKDGTRTFEQVDIVMPSSGVTKDDKPPF